MSGGLAKVLQHKRDRWPRDQGHWNTKHLCATTVGSQITLLRIICMGTVGKKQSIYISSLKGDLQGEHWDVLISILPLYQAIMTVSIGNGEQTSFWMDDWHGDDALADHFPILFSHCKHKEVSVKTIMDSGLANTLVSHLTVAGTVELQNLQELLSVVDATDRPDTWLTIY